ncbi:glycosyltransferase family 2 protein [Paenibacillus kobensis]|uniref:glycosyltransferase family 2 protein n=1 Tax=Paenibacillus kobensis TaxID=59841 RepID=UPI001FE9BA19|nr:glycosyltransferase family A protein [Paenibacillus kobensis]
MQSRRKARSSDAKQPGLVLPAGCRAAAVVMAYNEERTLPLVLEELAKLSLEEIVVVLNGCTDGSFREARSFPGVTIVHYADKIGHDVGRAVGARMCTSDIVLFVDGDFRIAAEKLKPFIAAVARGTDVALNDISPYLPLFRDWDDVTRLKAFLNLSLGRPDLHASSLTSVPHALSRRAIERIGSALLAVPPKAQAAAIADGLIVRTAGSVNVVTANRMRNDNVGRDNEVARLIVGDHVEALKHVMDKGGARLSKADTSRRREAIARSRQL